jgi:heptaprenyl diphosphate synthase
MRSKKIAFLGLMLALIIVLLWFERMLPPLPFLPPHMKLGISNVVIMFVLLFIGVKESFTLAVLKSLFNLLIRGPIAGLLSLSGGLLSVLVIVTILWISRRRASYIALSISGAILHNAGQLIVFCVIMRNWRLLLAYSPYLLAAGAILGTLSGLLLQVLLPTLGKIHQGFGGADSKPASENIDDRREL